MTRVHRPTQFGSADLAGMSPEEINAARRAGHLTDVMSGKDPDATVEHLPGCPAPAVERVYRLDKYGHSGKSSKTGDPIEYRCAACGATTTTNTEEN